MRLHRGEQPLPVSHSSAALRELGEAACEISHGVSSALDPKGTSHDVSPGTGCWYVGLWTKPVLALHEGHLIRLLHLYTHDRQRRGSCCEMNEFGIAEHIELGVHS
jgi:hypothetical protein